MSPVSIAPSIRQALGRITAKDPKSPDHVHSNHCTGLKFWDPESDSNPECEDLGDANQLSMDAVASASMADNRIMAASCPPTATARPRIEVVPRPRAYQASWKMLWKGPLPPRRVTPAATIGAFVQHRVLPPLHQLSPTPQLRSIVADSHTMTP